MPQTQNSGQAPDLRNFLNPLIGLVAITLLPVVLTAFLTIPFNLGRYPGEAAPQGAALRHMT
jgi:hypothetical protein